MKRVKKKIKIQSLNKRSSLAQKRLRKKLSLRKRQVNSQLLLNNKKK